MSDLLITIGDSFTYGEGLQFHLWKNKYSASYDMFHKKTSYEPGQTISTSFEEFDAFRKKHNYTGLLSNLLNTNIVTNSGNGGSNYGALETLDTWINYIKSERKLLPKLIVFQFTNIIRDITHVQTQYRSTGGIFGTEFYNEIKEVIAKLNSSNGLSKTDIIHINPTMTKIFYILLAEVKKRFEILKSEYDTKCIYFIGNSYEYNSEILYDELKKDVDFLNLIYNDNFYFDWDTLNRKNRWTLRGDINVNDDHPCLDSHQWLANQLYKKYLEISK
jgi:hypothetical protein